MNPNRRANDFMLSVVIWSTEQIKLTEAIVKLIGEVQKMMLVNIEKANICIECNPTSNIRIGRFKGYSQHPIVRMFNYMLNVDEEPHDDDDEAQHDEGLILLQGRC